MSSWSKKKRGVRYKDKGGEDWVDWPTRGRHKKPKVRQIMAQLRMEYPNFFFEMTR